MVLVTDTQHLFCGYFGQVLVQESSDVFVNGRSHFALDLLHIGWVAVEVSVLDHCRVARTKMEGNLLAHHHLLSIRKPQVQ